MGVSIGLGPLAEQSSALQFNEDRLIQGIRSPKSAADSAKIEKGAREFEAVLVGSWLQQAEQSFGTVPGADEGEDVGRGSMMSLGVQTLATSIAATGGIGIGKMVAKAMHAAADKADGTPAPAANELEGKVPASVTLVPAKRIAEKR